MIPAVRYLESKHLSIFAPKRWRWLGDPISAHYQLVAPENCSGSLDYNAEVFADPELPGYRLNGWAWDPRSRKTAKSIVITDKQGRILGFGYTGFDRPDVRATRFDIGWGVGWTAYIPGLSHDFVAAYMVARDGSSACLIGDHKLESVYRCAS